MSNVCTRCGCERMLAKTWQEVVEAYGRKTTIIHQEFVCKDSDCQRIVAKQLLAQKEKRESYERNRQTKHTTSSSRVTTHARSLQ